MNNAIIIGAGPAGLITAIKLKKEGFDSIVLEEHEEIGLPENCSGLVSRKGLEEQKIDFSEAVQNKIRGAKIFSPNGTELKVTRPQTIAYVLDRKKFDSLLLRKARSLGIHIATNTKLLDVRNNTLFVQANGRGEMRKAEYVIGADGVNSTVRHLMEIKTSKENFIHTIQATCTGEFEKEYVQLYLGDYAKGFFAWVIPIDEKKAKIGLGNLLGENITQNFKQFISEKLPNVRVYSAKSSLIPYSEPLQQIQKNNLMLVGDAAFQTKATSIDYEEPILLMDDNGFIRNNKIGELVDKELTNPENEIIISENNEIVSTKNEIKSLSPSKNADTNTFRTIKTMLRHKIEEDLYEVELQKGYRVKATASHSIMVVTQNGFEEKYTNQLIPGKDIIALNANIPKGKIIREINLIKEFLIHDKEFSKQIQIVGEREKIYSNYSEVNKNKITQHWYNNIIPLNKFIEKGILPENSIISIKKSKFNYKNKIQITPEFCRLLGYFIAEGSFKNNNLTMTFGMNDIKKGVVDDALFCIEKSLGIKAEKPVKKFNPLTKEESAISISFGGTIAMKLFEIIGTEKRAKTKQVPWIIFNVEDELKIEFLKGYFRGDGNLRIRIGKNSRHNSIELSAKTISKKLISDLIIISMQLNLFPSIENENKKENMILGKKFKLQPSYKIVFSRIQDIKKLIDIFPEMKSKCLAFLENKKSKETIGLPIELLSKQFIKTQAMKSNFGNSIYSYNNLGYQRLKLATKNNVCENEFINNLITQGIILLKVKRIHKVKPTTKYVYDVEIPETQMFCGGIGPILLHNTGGGIVFGMRSGSILANTISQTIKKQGKLSDYQKNLREINKELRMHWKIRSYVNSLSNNQIDDLFEKLKSKGIEEFLEKEGNMDDPSLFLGKLIKSPKYWFMVKTLIGIARS